MVKITVNVLRAGEIKFGIMYLCYYRGFPHFWNSEIIRPTVFVPKDKNKKNKKKYATLGSERNFLLQQHMSWFLGKQYLLEKNSWWNSKLCLKHRSQSACFYSCTFVHLNNGQREFVLLRATHDLKTKGLGQLKKKQINIPGNLDFSTQDGIQRKEGPDDCKFS